MDKHLFLSHLHLLKHETGSHPENASRLKAILEAFKESPFQEYLDLSTDRFASIDDIALAHDLPYIHHVLSLDGQEASVDAETLISSQSVKAALLAAGLGIELVEQVVQKIITNGFALVRPPGHHARPSTGMGFCLFNNIAIAAKRALAMGIKRILILDWDVHHGNGTQEVFYEDNRVMFVDLHQENLFPVHSGLIHETGRGIGAGFTVNVPLPASCVDQDYLYLFDALVMPIAKKFEPELILVSAGFDAHESDPLGFMKLTTEGFGQLAQRVKGLADLLCAGKLVFFLEGGYNPFFLAKNVMECANALIQEINYSEIIEVKQPASNRVKEIVKEIYDSRFKY